jgi:uncharacterized protein YndB with AHSA1/START domain
MSVPGSRIVKEVVLRAPRSRVWRAITDSSELGRWFGMRLEGPFRAGAPIFGIVVPTEVDPVIASHQKPFEGHKVELLVERIEPEQLFSFRWHPYAIEPGVDYSSEPTTLVTFELSEVAEGIKLTVTESGFENVPEARREQAFRSNEGGWAAQMGLVEKFLAQNP